MRRGEIVDIASAKEREVIKKQKEINFSETRNAPPILFGTGVGAVVGGLLLGSVGEKVTGKKEGSLGGVVVGSFIGGVFGGLMGSSYKNVMEIKTEWFRVPLWGRLVAIAVGGLSALVVWIARKKVSDKLKLASRDTK